jgi:hypothetical protein
MECEIQSFEQGNPASNLEIAIAGYEVSLKVCTREAFPHDWEHIQQDLMIADQQRQQIFRQQLLNSSKNYIKIKFVL